MHRKAWPAFSYTTGKSFKPSVRAEPLTSKIKVTRFRILQFNVEC